MDALEDSELVSVGEVESTEFRRSLGKDEAVGLAGVASGIYPGLEASFEADPGVIRDRMGRRGMDELEDAVPAALFFPAMALCCPSPVEALGRLLAVHTTPIPKTKTVAAVT